MSLANVQNDLTYSRAVRSGYERSGAGGDIAGEIGLPGLANVSSQHVVPIEARDQLLGVMCFEDEQVGRFRFIDDFVFHLAAREIGLQLTVLRGDPVRSVDVTAQAPAPVSTTPSAQVRYYAVDDSVFGSSAHTSMLPSPVTPPLAFRTAMLAQPVAGATSMLNGAPAATSTFM